MMGTASRNLLACGLVCGMALAAMGHEGPGAKHEHAPPDAAAVTRCVRTGEGAFTFESVANWCKLPEGAKTLGATHGGIVVDKAGNIYFSMDGGPFGMMVYAPDGTLIRGMMADHKKMHGLCIREEGGEEFIYAAHLGGKQAIKFKLDGTIVWTIGLPTESGKYANPGQYNPTGIAVAPNGDIFIADGYGQNWIHQYSKDQKYIRSFGGGGAEPGKFRTAHGLLMDTRGEKPLLLVCDRENRRLQHFDLDGKFVAVITENLRRPCSASLHGKQIVIAELEARVTIIDENNKPVAFLGDNPNRKQWANFGVPPTDMQEGIFTAPHGVSFDKDGNVYVMDWNASGRLSRLNLVKP